MNSTRTAALIDADTVDRGLQELFGDAARHTEEDRRVIAFVEKYLDSVRNPFPKPRRYLVTKGGGQWAVSLLDLESLRRGDRAGELIVYVEESKGRLLVVGGGVR